MLGDSVLLLSPIGAEMLIDWCSESPHDLVETVIHRKAHQEISPGCYSAFEGGYYYKGGNLLESPHPCIASGVLYLEKWTGKTDSERTLLK